MNVVLDRERGMVTPSQSHTHIDVMCYYYVGHSAARLYDLPTFICILYRYDEYISIRMSYGEHFISSMDKTTTPTLAVEELEMNHFKL